MLPVEEPSLLSLADLVATEFEQYLVTERGLLSRTAAAQAARVRRFLTGYCPTAGVGQLTTAEVTAALLAEGTDHAVSSVKRLGYTLKAFLRYAFLTGLIDRDLSGASIPVRAHQPSLLPIGISRKHTEALLAACDRETVVGRRVYAVILLLARLGMRAIEVARLQVDDIDWHHGEITVRGKGRRDERMPLPAEVGQGLVDYLMRSRPTDAPEVRTVFLAVRAPRRPMDRVTVSSMVARVCERAGVPSVGAHLLRHSLGEAMIRAEVPLAAIGQVLRHHDPLSTTNYARVDVERLRGLAQPWPTSPAGGGHPMTAATEAETVRETGTGTGTAGTLAQWWTAQLEDYLRLRRSLGFSLVWDEHLLRRFSADLALRGIGVVTVADAVAWSLALPPGQTHRPVSRASVRLTAVRGFATYLRSLDPVHEIPPRDMFGWRKTRPAPYIYTPEEMVDSSRSQKRQPSRRWLTSSRRTWRTTAHRGSSSPRAWVRWSRWS